MQQNNSITAICSLEHIPALNQGTTTIKTFGLNLSMAWTGSHSALGQYEKLLMPWKIKPIEKIMVAIAAPRTVPVTVLERDIEPQFFQGALLKCNSADEKFTKFQAKFRDEVLEGYWSSYNQNSGAFNPTNTEPIDVTKESGRQWQTLLSQVAVLPAPMPQLLNLSFVFHVPSTAFDSMGNNPVVYAAPILTLDSGLILKPAIERLNTVSNIFLEWKYPITEGLPASSAGSTPLSTPETTTVTPSSSSSAATPAEPSGAMVSTANGPVITANCGVCELIGSPNQGDYLNLNTLWVNAKLDEYDWRSELEQDMSGAFDMSHRIIELLQLALRNAEGDDTKLKEIQQNIPIYTEMFVASLRDIAGVGYDVSPYGSSLLAYLMNLTTDQPSTTPRAYDIANWKRVIGESLPQFSKLAIIVGRESRISISEVLNEMDALHNGVLEPENLLKLSAKQWEESPPYLDRINENKERLNKINLRNELAFENLGRFWQQFIASGIDDLEKTKEKFKCYFQAYCYLRFGHQAPVIGGCTFGTAEGQLQKPLVENLMPRITMPVPLGIIDALSAHVRAWCDTFWNNKMGVVANGTTALTPVNQQKIVPQTPSAHNVTFQVDRVGADPRSRDFLESISGVAVLIRKYGSGSKVTCLNMAKVKLTEESDDTLFEFPVLVPYPIAYVNNLRSPNITYSNNPLTAKSPVAHMTETGNDLRGENPDAKVDRLVFFDYPMNFADAAKNAEMQALIFGQKYHIKVFSVNRQGVIPPALNPSGGGFSPAEIAYKQLPVNLLPDASTELIKLENFPYLRRVKVGQVRIFGSDGKDCLKNMKIPDKVYPLSRELEKIAETSIEPNKRQPKKSMLLLVPDDGKFIGGMDKFTFQVRLPAIDISAWDRWVMGFNIHNQKKSEAYIKSLRRDIWAGYRKISNEQTVAGDECSPIDKANDSTIDDPAVLNEVYIEIIKLNENTGEQIDIIAAEKLPLRLNIPNSEPVPGAKPIAQLNHVQSNYGEVEIIAADVSPLESLIKVDNIKCTVKIPKKEKGLYSLRFSALVPEIYFDGKDPLFDQIYDRQITKIEKEKLLRVGTFEMLVEVADSSMPKPNEIDNYVTTDFLFAKDNGGDGDAVVVRLKNPANSNNLIHRAEVNRQMWRWQGRNTKLHPGLQKESPESGEISVWELAEYSNRQDNDFNIINMTSPHDSNDPGKPLLPSGVRDFEYIEYLTGKLAGKPDLRAHHYRFKVRIYSRYEGLFKDPKNATVLSKTWKPCLVPCRFNREVPVPKVKFIFPLTQSFDASNSSGTAGLLVVLDEPWHEVAGLAEKLHAEVEFTEAYKYKYGNPNSAGNSNTNTNTSNNANSNSASEDANFAKEAGKNPIFSKESIMAKTGVFVSEKIVGPIGHSFDTNTDAPYIGATSFIIPAPEIRDRDGGQPKKFDWGMCQVSFQRLVIMPKSESPDPLKSKLSDPVWVEYLPEFTKYAEQQLDVLSHKIAGEVGSLIVQSQKGGSNLKIIPDSNNFEFTYFMVITKEVFDIAGRRGQEAFTGVLKLDRATGDKWLPIAHSRGKNFVLPALNKDRFLGRILKIQRNPNGHPNAIETAADLWDSLFGSIWKDKNNAPRIEDIDRSRIVSISDPIASNKMEKC